MDLRNLSAYNSGAVIKWYNHQQGLFPAEKAVFEKYSTQLAQARLLDIGIGGGRTTTYLLKACKQYTGIDYSEKFIAGTKKNYPGNDIRLMDARNLSVFQNATFDFVNFSLNGMDYVDLPGRKKILAEISRVVKPDGVFFFSTHNMAHASFNKAAWRDASVSAFVNFKTFIRLLPFYFRHQAQKKKEAFFDSYAIINDCAHAYQLLTLYSQPAFLREQLARHGFSNIRFLTKKGSEAADEQLDNWIFVTCTKATA